MKKSLITAAVVLALSASMAHADSRSHRAAQQQNTAPATEQSVTTTSQPAATTGQGNRADRAVQVKGRGQLLMQQQGQRAQVTMSNQNNLNQTGNIGSMVIGNQNSVNTGSSVAQMSATNVQTMQGASVGGMQRHRERMGAGATTAATTTPQTGDAGQQVQNPGQGQGRAVQKSDISNTIQQTGAISSTVTGGNLNSANAASLSMTSVTRNPIATSSEQVAGSSMGQGRRGAAATGETALGRQPGAQRNGLMSTAIRNEVQQTGAISSAISGGDNNSANAASIAMKGTTLGGGVRNAIVGTGDISAKISDGNDNRANAGSVALGETTVGGHVVNDVRNTGAISSTIEQGSNNMANAASISIN